MVSFKIVLSFYATIAFFYASSAMLLQAIFLLVSGTNVPNGLFKLSNFFGTSWPLGILSIQPHGKNRIYDSSPNQVMGDDTSSLSTVQSPAGMSGNGLEYHTQMFLTEDIFLSRAFSQAMQPSKIIPFYYRASGSFSRDDITIATLVTGNRFEVLGRLVQQYQGPISVAIHITDTPKRRSMLLASLHELYTKTPGLAQFLDVHLVLDVFERQFNTWRNIARFFAAHRTDFVFMLDVDFSLCTDFRSRIRDSAASEVVKKLRLGTAALVIPAFEYKKHEEGVNVTNFPQSKESLLTLARMGKLGMFHASWEPGHNSTNYKRYYKSLPGEVYKISDYQQAYEPYIIFKNVGSPWCDERFIGYGGNKAACLFEMWLSGMDFFVLSDDFIIHQSHYYAEHIRKQERKYNRKTYTEFREETCIRYLRYFLATGTLATSRGHNLQLECRKIKGFARVAAEFISTQ